MGGGWGVECLGNCTQTRSLCVVCAYKFDDLYHIITSSLIHPSHRIKDGEVRVYQSARSYSDLVEYVEEQLWKNVDPVPWWRSPTASQ